MAAPLTLVPLGTGAAYGRPGEAQSSYLVRCGPVALCLDMGSGTFNRLSAHLAPEELDAVIISHLHPDHIVDLLAARVYMAWGPGRGRQMRVLGPPGLRDRLAAFGGDDGWDGLSFEDLALEGGRQEVGEGVEIAWVQVPHLAPTFAARVDAEGGSLCYGADCAPNTPLPELARGCDLLLAECSFGAGPAAPGVPHLTAGDAAVMAAQAGVDRLLLTHCYPEFDRDEALAQAREAFSGTVDWAREGVEVVA